MHWQHQVAKKPFVALSGKLISRQPKGKLKPVTKEADTGTGPVLYTRLTATETDSTISATSASAVQGDYLPEHTAALAAAELFSNEVHIYSALLKPLVYKPYSKAIVNTPLKMAFYEPAHFVAFVSVHKDHCDDDDLWNDLNSKSPSSNQ